MAAINNGKKTCPSMHIVLQSGSNFILKRMNRKYTRQQFFTALDTLKSHNKDFTFTTDIIVGFPGESDADFAATLAVIEEVGFAKVHMFPYSKRERTKAATYQDSVPATTIHQRKQILLRAAEKAAYQLREQFIGRDLTVLWESIEGEEIFGHTENFLPVYALKQGLAPNTISTVKISGNRPTGLVGRCE